MPPDILISEQNAAAPALSATSDTPVIVPPAPDPSPAPSIPPGPEPAAPPEPDEEPGQEVPPEAPEGEAAQEAREDGSPRQRDGRLWRERRLADERLKAADERYDRLAALAERLISERQRPPETPLPVQQPPPTAEPRPNRDNFDTPESYDAAWMQWTTREAGRIAQIEVDRKLTEQRQADAQTAAEQRQREQFQRTNEEWQDRRAKAIERMPDYLEIAERDDVPISTSMALIIQRSERGPEIAYHLGKHPEEAARIAAMVVPGQFFPRGHPDAGQPIPDMQRQLFELGSIAAIAAAPRPEITRAPAPIKPLGASNAAAKPRTLYDVGAHGTSEEYAAMRMPQLQAERRPGMLGVPVGEVRRP